MSTIIYNNKEWENKEWLENIYSSYGLTYIASLCSCSETTLRTWMKKHNIKTRTAAESSYISKSIT